jgi:hypothetical protein
MYEQLAQITKDALEGVYERGVVKREDVDERALEYLASLPGGVAANAVEELARANLSGKYYNLHSWASLLHCFKHILWWFGKAKISFKDVETHTSVLVSPTTRSKPTPSWDHFYQ